MIVFLNGEYIEQETATIHISDLALQRGYGIFEFMKIREGVPLFIDDYLDRFMRSASEMRLPLKYTRDDLKNIVYEVLSRNNSTNCGIKFILTGGNSPDAYEIAEPNFFVSQYPLNLKDELSEGIKVITHQHVREISQVKSINYITGIHTLNKMRDAGAQDVLYHVDGVVTEFPRCNFFMVSKEGVLRTPDKNVLAGITRKNILKIAEPDIKVDVGTVTIDDIKNASEAFLTSTTKRNIPIVQVDDTVIGDGKPGPVTEKLFHRLIELEEVEIKTLAN